MTGLTGGVKYTFTVRAYDENGAISYYTGGKGAVYVAAPRVTAVTAAAKGAKVTWAPVAGAVKYRVYWRTDATGWRQIKKTTAGTSYTVTGLTGGERYAFTVRAYAKDGAISSYTGGKGLLYEDVADEAGGTAAPGGTGTSGGTGGTGSSSGGAGASGVPEDSNGTAYALNTNTMKFHRPSCRWVDDIAAENREDVKADRDAVIAAGYVPCQVCDP